MNNHAEADTLSEAVPASRFTISVVVPAYNAASTLRQTLASVAGQTRQPDEVIIVNDASTDATVEVARSFGDVLHIRVVEQPQNAGVGMARRAGLEAATSDAISFVDSDDVWLPHHLHELSRIYTGRGCIATAQFLAWTPGVAIDPTPSAGIIALPPPDEQALTILEGSFLWIAGLFSLEDYRKTEGYQSFATGEDWDVWIQLLLNGARAVQCHVPTVLYRQRVGSLTTDFEGMLKREIEILERHVPDLTGRRLRRAKSTIRRRKARFDMIEGIRTAANGEPNRARLFHLKAALRDRSLRRLNPAFNGSVTARALLGIVQPARGAESLSPDTEIEAKTRTRVRSGAETAVGVVIHTACGADIASTIASVFALNPLPNSDLSVAEIAIVDDHSAGAVAAAAARYGTHLRLRVLTTTEYEAEATAARSGVVLHIEAGDIVLPDHLDVMLAAHTAGRSVRAQSFKWTVSGDDTVTMTPTAPTADGGSPAGSSSARLVESRPSDGGSKELHPILASGLTVLHRVDTVRRNEWNEPLTASSIAEATTSISCVQCGNDSSTSVYEHDGYHLVRCTQCDLVYVSNPPTQEQLAEI